MPTEPAPRRGHPGKAPRKTMTLRIDVDLRARLYELTKRPASVSDTINEILRKHIGRPAPRRK